MLNLDSKIEKFFDRKREIENMLSDSSAKESSMLTALSKELSEIRIVTNLSEDLDGKNKEIFGLNQVIKDQKSEIELIEMAKIELKELEQEILEIKKKLQLALLPKDKDDERNVILEIRAGTGGDEAGLFASNLFSMYQRFSANNNWKFEIMNISETGVGGYKEAHANIIGNGAFGNMKFESGVHRVQRVPLTETNGRIHTSAATVAVLPEAKELEINLEEKDIRVDVFRASGPGGQSVNTTDSAVRLTHMPTGIVVSQQDEKSQHKNRAKAMKILMARLYDLERTNRENERATERKSQVGSGDRSERIRTYNFPQGRVTDHRINLTLHKIEKVLEGEALGEVIDNLILAERMKKLGSDD